MPNKQWFELLMMYLNSLRGAGWKSQADQEYYYATSWVGSALVLGVISMEERDRILVLAKNARQYAMKEMQ